MGAAAVPAATIESAERPGPPRARSSVRAVAVPTEHGGWGLTSEPVVLGLLLASTLAGWCLGLAAFLAFLARTPLKVLLVDAHRGRSLDRTRTARIVLAVELVVLAALVAVVVWRAEPGWWIPAVLAAPLVAVELWFDMRSRSRRLVPELAGAVGIAGVVAMIAVAGGRSGAVAAAAWILLAGRAVTAIVSVRDLVMALHGRSTSARLVVVGEVVAVAASVGAVLVERAAWLGAVAVVGAIVTQRVLRSFPVSRPAILGIRQSVLGLLVVLATAIGLGIG